MGEKLKIGITCYPTFGGSGVVATEIGMAMAQRGHRVHFICYDVPRRLNRFSQNIFFHEVEVHDNPLFDFPPYSLALSSKMVEVAQYEDLDIFHVHYAVPHATSAYLAKQILNAKAPKIITTLHGTDITLVGNERSYLPITRFSILESDGVTVPSHFLKNATYDKLNVPTATDIRIIPNFIDSEQFSPGDAESKEKFRQSLGHCPVKGRILVHVSNFRPVKRIDDVIRVFEKVTKQIDSHLVLVGDGPERSKIEALVRDLNLQNKVCFLGKQQLTQEIVRNCDLFLLPSSNESFGLAALEALSTGVPVIGSNAEGIPEVVKHAEVGYLADIGDVETMASYAVKLLSNHKEYDRMSKAAREYAIAEYSKDKLIDQYESYYYEILKEKA
ncbi:MAG: N-acetyl-alpha-D-glucosaminyl L-malate synthase BshA [Deltaproteobacteria bacterium]|nr:N-acetyl-alpha-D-glucosaminyl L-malate synthase BshA [Deltaproteobacteria bacterium]